jgi:hypothetical protein
VDLKILVLLIYGRTIVVALLNCSVVPLLIHGEACLIIHKAAFACLPHSVATLLSYDAEWTWTVLTVFETSCCITVNCG